MKRSRRISTNQARFLRAVIAAASRDAAAYGHPNSFDNHRDGLATLYIAWPLLGRSVFEVYHRVLSREILLRFARLGPRERAALEAREAANEERRAAARTNTDSRTSFLAWAAVS